MWVLHVRVFFFLSSTSNSFALLFFVRLRHARVLNSLSLKPFIITMASLPTCPTFERILHTDFGSNTTKMVVPPWKFCCSPSLDFSLILKPSPTKTSQQQRSAVTYFHEHFVFRTIDDVDKMVSHLEHEGFTPQLNTFLDQYFDTKSYELEREGILLRNRDGEWVLLQVLDERGSTVLTIQTETDKDLIIRRLCQIGKNRLVSIDSGLYQASIIERLCPRRTTILPTCRLALTSEGNKSEVLIDTYFLNEVFHTVGCIKTEQDNSNHKALLEDISQFVVFPAQSLLFPSKVESYESALESANDSAEKIWQRSTFKGVSNPPIPYDYFQRAADKAVGAVLPLQAEYYAIKEREWRESLDDKEEDD